MLTFWPPKLVKPAFQLACNGLSVVSHLQALQPIIGPMEPHVDLLAAACNLINTSGYLVELVFVHGHQDTGHPTALTRVELDQLAKNNASLPHTSLFHYKLPGYLWSCYMGKQHIVKQLQKSLWTFVNGKTTLEYWEKCKNCQQEQLKEEVDWMSLGCVMQVSPY